MGAPTVGAVVLIPFPFSDLSGAKKRPALVLVHIRRGIVAGYGLGWVPSVRSAILMRELPTSFDE